MKCSNPSCNNEAREGRKTCSKLCLKVVLRLNSKKSTWNTSIGNGKSKADMVIDNAK